MGYLQGMAAALLVMSLAGCQPDGVRPDGTVAGDPRVMVGGVCVWYCQFKPETAHTRAVRLLGLSDERILALHRIERGGLLAVYRGIVAELRQSNGLPPVRPADWQGYMEADESRVFVGDMCVLHCNQLPVALTDDPETAELVFLFREAERLDVSS